MVKSVKIQVNNHLSTLGFLLCLELDKVLIINYLKHILWEKSFYFMRAARRC